MSLHDLLPGTVSASNDKVGKDDFTDEVRARMRKVHDKAKQRAWDTPAVEYHAGPLAIQSSFTEEVTSPVKEEMRSGEDGEDRLPMELVTAPVNCEDSDPEFDGVICVLIGCPSSSFNVALVGCPSFTEFTRDYFFCGGCLVYAGDLDNEYFCTSCSLCSDKNDVGFDCDNVGTGDCVAYDCTTGFCSSVGGGQPPSTGTTHSFPNSCPFFQSSSTTTTTTTSHPFSKSCPFFNAPPPPPPTPFPNSCSVWQSSYCSNRK
jgi:hypothetical protein